MELDKANIYFVASRWGDAVGEAPDVAAKSLPPWYKTADRYGEDGKSTFRNCVPFFDAMTSGYIFQTPCDVNFEYDGYKLVPHIEDVNFKDFINVREPLPQFHHPEGYYSDHFAFLPQWGVGLEPGYSAIYMTPINRFDLPFIITSGIIDNDKMNTPGMVPFFIRKGFSGLIPKGTPFMQCIPFKREHWNGIPVYGTEAQIGRNLKRATKFRSVKSDFYRDNLWERKKYRVENDVNLGLTEGEDNVGKP